MVSNVVFVVSSEERIYNPKLHQPSFADHVVATWIAWVAPVGYLVAQPNISSCTRSLGIQGFSVGTSSKMGCTSIGRKLHIFSLIKNEWVFFVFLVY